MSEFPFPFFGAPNEEQLREIKEAQHRQEIAQEDFRHGVQRMIEEMSEEYLSLWRTILGHISASEHDHEVPIPMTNILYGQITWELKKRFNICASCGVDHSKEIAPEQTSTSEAEQVEEEVEETVIPAGVVRIRGDGVYEWSDEALAEMNRYHLDDLYKWNDEETWAEFQGFACTGIEGSHGPCGMTYISIADRKLREPEVCSGCFQRNMHG